MDTLYAVNSVFPNAERKLAAHAEDLKIEIIRI